MKKIYARNFGSDPEYFIGTQKGNSFTPREVFAIPPAALKEDFNIPFIGITNNGKRILTETDQYRWIEDGVAVELNFKNPINSPDIFYNIVSHAINSFQSFLYSKNHSLFLISNFVAINFDTSTYGKTRGDEFLDCIRFGCDKDYRPNFYELFDTGCEIVDSSTHPERYAGGHFHMQNMSNDEYVYIDQVETFPLVLDLFLGTTNVILSRSEETIRQERNRLNYFGFPGKYRIQQYSESINGVEYRPPSNVWTTQYPFICAMFEIGNICGKIIENRLTDNFTDIIFSSSLPDFYTALANFNKDYCKSMLRKAIALCLNMNILDLSNVKNISSYL